MTTTRLPNTQLNCPDVGSEDNTWGNDLRVMMFNDDSVAGGGVDDLIAGVLTKTVTVGAYTLSAVEAAHHTIVLTGSLTGNVTVTVPSFQRNYRFRNETAGGPYTCTVQVGAGPGIVVRRDIPEALSSDGTRIFRAAGPRPAIAGPSGGSANAYTLTLSPPITTYELDALYGFRANFTNTGPATLSISSLAATSIKKWRSGAKVALGSGDITNGQQCVVAYDGTDMVALAGGAADTGPIPAGTVMVFYAPAAPTGWTAAAANDRVLRVVNSGTTGGTLGGTGWAITGLTAAHVHGVGTLAMGGPSATLTNINLGGVGVAASSSHTHDISSGSTGAASPSTVTSDGLWRPFYADVILASKN